MIETERDRLQISLVILSESKLDAIKLRRHQLDAIKLLHILNHVNYSLFIRTNHFRLRLSVLMHILVQICT